MKGLLKSTRGGGKTLVVLLVTALIISLSGVPTAFGTQQESSGPFTVLPDNARDITLDTLAAKDVYKGKEGWLFYRGNYNLELVTVVNFKPSILAAKDAGQQVYRKTDTHWSALGAYAGYKRLLAVLSEKGAVNNTEPVRISFAEESFETDLIRILGDSSLSATERDLVIEWGAHAKMSPDDDRERLAYCSVGSPGSTLFKNPYEQGRLLLYGDSFMMPQFAFLPRVASQKKY
jgi:hypothetical protein